MSKYPDLRARFFTAIVGVAILISAIVWKDWSYFVIFLAICVLTQMEFYKVVGLDGQVPLKWYGSFCSLVVFTLSFLVLKGLAPINLFYLTFPLLAAVFFIQLYKTRGKPFSNIAFTFLGIIYVGFAFGLLNIIAFHPGTYSFQLVLGILILHWANDVGAYFAGVTFGKTKLFERLSPKKSWEGFVGGFVLCLVFAWVWTIYFDHLEDWQWIIIGIIVPITSTMGDLVESMFKRSMEIKDSAEILPGHGGFLDRFDGLLLSVPFIIAFLKIF